MLITFISNLIQNDEKRRAFAQNPMAEMIKAGLGREAQVALASRDSAVVARLIERELRSSIIPLWGAPPLRVTPPVDPDHGKPGAHIEPFTLRGEWFDGEDRMTVTLEGPNLALPIPVKVQSVAGVASQHSTLVGSFTIPPGATPGPCTLRVVRTLDGDSDTVPNGFRIEPST